MKRCYSIPLMLILALRCQKLIESNTPSKPARFSIDAFILKNLIKVLNIDQNDFLYNAQTKVKFDLSNFSIVQKKIKTLVIQ